MLLSHSRHPSPPVCLYLVRPGGLDLVNLISCSRRSWVYSSGRLSWAATDSDLCHEERSASLPLCGRTNITQTLQAICWWNTLFAQRESGLKQRFMCRDLRPLMSKPVQPLNWHQASAAAATAHIREGNTECGQLWCISETTTAFWCPSLSLGRQRTVKTRRTLTALLMSREADGRCCWTQLRRLANVQPALPGNDIATLAGALNMSTNMLWKFRCTGW